MPVLLQMSNSENGFNKREKDDGATLLYAIDDIPPWHISIFTGFQVSTSIC